MDADVANLLDTNSTFMAAIFIAAVVLSSSAYRESGMGAKVEEVFIVLYVILAEPLKLELMTVLVQLLDKQFSLFGALHMI